MYMYGCHTGGEYVGHTAGPSNKFDILKYLQLGHLTDMCKSGQVYGISGVQVDVRIPAGSHVILPQVR